MMVKKEKDEKEKDVITVLSAPVFRVLKAAPRNRDSTSGTLGRGHSTCYPGGLPGSVTLSHCWDDTSEGGPLVGLASSSRPMDGINGGLGGLTSRLIISAIS
jgi:hypothetical protein